MHEDQSLNSPSYLPYLDLAGKLAGLFAALPQVEAVALGGSQAGGNADMSSDIDLYIYTRADIPMAARQTIVEQAGGASQADMGLAFWGPGDEWFHAGTGIEIDVVFFDAGWMEGQLQRILFKHQASLGYSTCFWYTLHNSHIFHDSHGWMASLQQACQVDYPEALRRNIIHLNHPVLRGVIPAFYHQIEKAVKRQDQVSVNHRLAALLASYFDIVFALNRVLHPGEKRLVNYALGHCEKLPVEMAADISAVLTTSASTGADLIEKPGQAAGPPGRFPGSGGIAVRRRRAGMKQLGRCEWTAYEDGG